MSNQQRGVLILVLVLMVLAIPVGRGLMFTVDERQMAVVLQFGRPVRACINPGLYFKLPLIQEVRYLPKTYQFWMAGEGEILVDLPTSDGKKIEVSPWAVWRITDPESFVRVLRSTENAELRVETYVRSSARDVFTDNTLAEAVRSTNRKLTYSLLESLGSSGPEDAPSVTVPDDAAEPAGEPVEPPSAQSPESGEKIEVGRQEIVRMIKEKVEQTLAQSDEGEQGNLGIELVDVGVSRIDFVADVREEAFKRLIAFYESIASYHDAEGRRLNREIVNRTNAEVEKTLGEGKQKANVTRGEVEAEIIDAYAKAIRETGEFYNFIRTLEAYQESLAGQTRLILSTDSELLQLLNRLTPAEPESNTTEPGEAPQND